MKTLLAVVLIVVGVWLVHNGWSRRESLAGKTESTLAHLGRKIDGETRVPGYTWSLVGGGLLVLGGLGVLVAGRKS